jgi:RNA polymerase sigma-70 factor (ECF subfamily)
MVADGERVETGFDAFFRVEYPALIALLDRVCSDLDTADDLAQEALARAFARWSEVAVHPNPPAWVRRVALNLAMSGHRTSRRRTAALQRMISVRPAPSGEGHDGDDERISIAICRLPVQQRAAVALFYLEDRPVAEIAELLECAPATARVHLHRGRRALHAALGSVLADEEDA